MSQTTIPFNVRKLNSKTFFYGKKETPLTQDFTNATVRLSSEIVCVPGVRKVAVLTSSDSDSDSDAENSVASKENSRYRRKRNTNGEVGTPARNGKEAESDDGDGDGATPPKQKKSDNSSSPSSPTTPSSLLNLLNLETAEERRKISPKRLFPSARFQDAKKALHVSLPVDLPGREKELTELREFLSERSKTGGSGSLYISGPPGTGKTATLSKIMLEPEFAESFKTIYVNCTAMKSGGAIYGKIVEDLGLDRRKTEAANKAAIEKYLATKHEMLLIVLDEIDQLNSRKHLVLYSIFEWPSRPDSKLVLIGIANALDLTDRILPRLRARCGLKPRLMHFAPYSREQIVDIISKRLREANVSDVLNGSAVQMLAAKVAAISGDIRKALDIGRRVIEIAEARRVSQILQPSKNNGINAEGGRSPDEHPRRKSVALTEVVELLNTVYGGAKNANNDESKFPLQQKLLLCSLMLILNRGRNKDVTIGKLYEVYKKICKKRSLPSLDISEFVSLCGLVETRGVLRIVGKNEPRLSKVYLQLDEEELGNTLQDKAMIAEIVQDVSCL